MPSGFWSHMQSARVGPGRGDVWVSHIGTHTLVPLDAIYPSCTKGWGPPGLRGQGWGAGSGTLGKSLRFVPLSSGGRDVDLMGMLWWSQVGPGT